jgi:hypothetical protein
MNELAELFYEYNLMTLNWGENFDVGFWKAVRQALFKGRRVLFS